VFSKFYLYLVKVLIFYCLTMDSIYWSISIIF
jgi:hypothetical protein